MFIDKLLVLILLSSALFFSSFAYTAEIYKWTDKQGNVHFGDRPENNPAKIYTVPKNNTANISTTNKQRAKKQQKLLDSFDADRRINKQQQAKKRKKSNKRKHNCKVVQDRFHRFTNAGRIFSRNEAGERSYLDNTQRQQELQYLKQQINKWCD